jgi:hypothetical protein
MAVVAVLALAGLGNGSRFFGCEDAHQAKLVAERVLHDRPVDRRRLSLVRMRTRIDARLPLYRATDRLDLGDRGIDVSDPDIDV